MAAPSPHRERSGLLDYLGHGESAFADWLDPRRNTIMGLAAGMIGHDSARDAMRGAAQGALQGRQVDTAYGLEMEKQEQQQEQLNYTIEAMRNAGPEFADLIPMAQAGLMGEAFNEYNRRIEAARNPDRTANQEDWLFAQQNPEFGEFLAQDGGGSSPSYSQTPVFLTDPQGNQVIGQMSSGGGVLVNGQVMNSLPQGWNITARPDNFSTVDMGGYRGVFDPNTGQYGPGPAIQGTPSANMDVTLGANGSRTMTPAAGSPEAIELSQQGGNAVANAQMMLDQIDGVLNDPNLGQAVGVGGLLPAIPGTAQAGSVARIQQLQGQAFLQAFEALKGAGQITEVEGLKAEQATARLQRPQREEDFVAALQELREVVEAGLERARSNYGAAPAGGTAPGAAPAPGSVMGSQPYAEGTVIENESGQRMVMRNGRWESE